MHFIVVTSFADTVQPDYQRPRLMNGHIRFDGVGNEEAIAQGRLCRGPGVDQLSATIALYQSVPPINVAAYSFQQSTLI